MINKVNWFKKDLDEYQRIHKKYLLHQAVEKNNKSVIKLLLDTGAEVDTKDNNGMTPLHWAALNNVLDVARLLLDNGADTTILDIIGRNALEIAVRPEMKALLTPAP